MSGVEMVAWPSRRTLIMGASNLSVVMPGLVPGIHVFLADSKARRGWPGQARP
jgi:hypothetical protein